MGGLSTDVADAASSFSSSMSGLGQEQNVPVDGLPFLWSFGDDFVTAVTVFSLARTLFYITRDRAGRPVPREMIYTFVKYWSIFYLLRVSFELWEDFAPAFAYLWWYQLIKMAVFFALTVRSMALSEWLFDSYLAPAIEEQKEEIVQLGVEWDKLWTSLNEGLIDVLEYIVGWLKRRYIMDGGSISLQPRHVVFDPAEEERHQARRDRLVARTRSEDTVAFFRGGDGLSQDRRLLERRQSLRGGPKAAEDNAEMDASLVSQSRRRSASARGGGSDDLHGKDPLPRTKSENPYERIICLRKQLREGSLKRN